MVHCEVAAFACAVPVASDACQHTESSKALGAGALSHVDLRFHISHTAIMQQGPVAVSCQRSGLDLPRVHRVTQPNSCQARMPDPARQ